MFSLRFLLFLLWGILVIGQSEAQITIDSITTETDTSEARFLLEHTKDLIIKGKYKLAYQKANRARLIYEQTVGNNSLAIAHAFHQMGDCEYYRGMLDEALEWYQQGLEIRQKKLEENHPDIAISYNGLGCGYMLKDKYDEALMLHKKALTIRLKLEANHPDIAESHHNMGGIYLMMGQHEKAILLLKKAIAIWSNQAGGPHPDTGDAYVRLGLAYEMINDFDQAIAALKIAIDISPKQRKVMTAYSHWGLCYAGKGDYSQAITYFQKAIAGLESLEFNRESLAIDYENIGHAYSNKENYGYAITFYEKALHIRLTKFTRLPIHIARLYSYLGTAYMNYGDYEKAISFFKKALHLHVGELNSSPLYIAVAYLSLANAYINKNEYNQAIAFQEKATQILSSELGEQHFYLGAAYLDLGLTYDKKGDLDQSITFYRKAIEVYKKQGLENRLPPPYNNLATVYHIKKEYETSLRFFQKALDIRLKQFGPEHLEVASLYNNFGISYYDGKKNEIATQYYQKALVANRYQAINFESVLSHKILLVSLKLLIKLHKTQFEDTQNPIFLNQAQDYVLQANELIRYLRNNYSQEAKILLENESHFIFELAISVEQLKCELEKDCNLAKKIYPYFEKSKAVALKKQIQETNALSFANLPDSLLQKEQQLRIDLTYYDKKRQEKRSQGVAEADTALIALSSQLFDLKQEYENLKQNFESNYPEYHRLKYDLATVSLAEVQRDLLTEDQTLLEYFVGDSSIFIITIQKNVSQVIEVKKDFPLNDVVKQLQNGLYGFYDQLEAKKTDELYNHTRQAYKEAAQQLYQKLVAPIKDKLTTKELIIIPDGVLGYVPFGTLLSGKPARINNWRTYPFLEKDYQISYCYSTSLLKEMKEKQHKKEPKESVVAFAPFYKGSYAKLDSTFTAAFETLANGQDTILWTTRVNRKDFNSLPNSGEEVKIVSEFWDGSYFINEQATEDRFNQMAGDARIVHLSTHGVVNRKASDYSYLAFAEQSDSLENEYLYVRDLYNLQLNADLVVLSACETGVGTLQKGEGIISLARAFAYAGAKSIVTTLWVADDAATKDLMKAFHLQLKNGQRKDKALQAAKMSLLERRQYGHPFFWAGFVPVGDMSVVK